MFTLDPTRIRAKLASGSFGTIHAYLNSDKTTESKDWVVKRIPVKDTKELKFFIQEAVLGFNHRHPFVVSNRGYDIRDSQLPDYKFELYIKMPRMERSLKKAIGDHNRANPKTKPTITDIMRHFFSVATGLDYLHSKRICHNNVNPGTILLDDENTAKIGSVGLAQHKPWKIEKESQEGKEKKEENSLITRIYAAPEKLDKYFVPEKDTAFKGDIWSLGITIIEFCLLGKVKKYYPETDDDDDDWLGLDSDESKTKEEKKEGEKKKMTASDFDFNKEEVKINDEKKMEPGAILIEENLEAIRQEYRHKLGDVGEPGNIQKLIDLLRKTLIVNPKERISAAQICKELENEFSLAIQDLSSIKSDLSKYEQELDENNNFFFYGKYFNEEEGSSNLHLSSAEESQMKVDTSETQESSLNPKLNG